MKRLTALKRRLRPRRARPDNGWTNAIDTIRTEMQAYTAQIDDLRRRVTSLRAEVDHLREKIRG